MAKSAVSFSIIYIIFMIPTYILPYFGSNSIAVNAISMQLSNINIAFYFHIICFIILIAITWQRASATGANWIIILPILAGLFDLTPVLNFIPLVPTVLHLLAIVLCVKGQPSMSETAATPR